MRSDVNRALRDMFDFKFVGMTVNYVEHKSGWNATILRDPSVASESLLRMTRTGASVLLGKNGSGKSRFLKSLNRFSAAENGDPHVVLRFAIPTEEDHLDYLEVVESIKSRSDYAEAVRERVDDWGNDLGVEALDRELFNLGFHDLLIESFTVPAYKEVRGFKAIFGTTSYSELLSHFGFADIEVAAFRDRQYDYHENSEWQGSLGVRSNLNFRDYFPEYFLYMLQGSFFASGEDQGPGSWFDCSQLIADQAERRAVVDDLRWCFGNASVLEVRVRDGGYQFSLIADPDASDEKLRSLESRRIQGMDYENVTFPFDMLRSDRRAATGFRHLDKEDGSGRTSSLFDIVDLTFQSREKSIDDVRTLFHEFVTVVVEPAEGSDYVVRTRTNRRMATVLTQSSRLLRESDIGIEEIRIRPHERSTVVNAPDWVLGRRTVDFAPVVQWRGTGDDKWHALETCSDGQLDVLRVTVQLVGLTARDHGRHVNIVLADEFNRHLHPTVSRVLLDQMDRFGKRYGKHVIASTHTFASLEAHRYPQILAERDERGHHRLSLGGPTDQLVLAAKLGVAERTVTELKKAIVLVEGAHDETILDLMLAGNPEVASLVEVVNLRGLYGLSSQWQSWLRHESADVLLVHDKRNEDLEAAWLSIQDRARKARIKEDLLTRYPAINDQLHSCEQRIRRARRDGTRVTPGDTETKSICLFLREVVLTAQEDHGVDGVANLVSRVHLHGIGLPDIVDTLPVKHFQNVGRHRTWDALRSDPSNVDLGADAFKSRFGITNDSVKRAATASFQIAIHPELQRLFARIVGILEVSSLDQDPRLDHS